MSAIPAISGRIIDCVQGGQEWFQARMGCVTSSRVADAVAKLKRSTNESAARYNLRMEMMCELLTGNPSQHFVSQWMEEGRDKEPLARAEYELLTGSTVEQIGFIYHPTIKRAGASPDGLIGDDGLIEIKCPKDTTHLRYLMDDAVPEEYQPQMLWQMACTERAWCDFVSYSPEVPEPYQLFIKRFERDDAVIAGMELEVNFFLEQVDESLNLLKERNLEEIG
jgi:putative phage-type endonuclease